MADLSDQTHVDALLNLLRADAGLTTYPDAEGFVPDARPDHYVRVYAAIERLPDAVQNNLNGLALAWTTYTYCHCVGPNEYSAGAVAMRVRAALLNVRPAIAGRNCGIVRQAAAPPPTRREEQAGVPVFDKIDVYRFTSTP